jgi:hypothetical protein
MGRNPGGFRSGDDPVEQYRRSEEYNWSCSFALYFYRALGDGLSAKSAKIRGGLMTLKNLIDTLLNLWVFAFIGILVWLYFKKESDTHKTAGQKNDPER